MGSPGLNVAALTITFMLLPAEVAGLRLASAIVLVFGLSALWARWFADAGVPVAPGEAPPESVGVLARRSRHWALSRR